jgi:hypothetical protein
MQLTVQQVSVDRSRAREDGPEEVGGAHSFAAFPFSYFLTARWPPHQFLAEV